MSERRSRKDGTSIAFMAVWAIVWLGMMLVVMFRLGQLILDGAAGGHPKKAMA